ncbi:unnamed protein product [Ilex paraguariensis]|uniref:Glycine-rich protein n=1 Tax=Ilex paraguariensis TaxID=185542 RepID=A0ABC8QSG3_9AQUA
MQISIHLSPPNCIFVYSQFNHRMTLKTEKGLVVGWLVVASLLLISPTSSSTTSITKEASDTMDGQAKGGSDSSHDGGWNFRCGCGSSPDGSSNYRWGAGTGPDGSSFGFGSGSSQSSQGGGGNSGGFAFGYGGNGGDRGGYANSNGRFGFGGNVPSQPESNGATNTNNNHVALDLA